MNFNHLAKRFVQGVCGLLCAVCVAPTSAAGQHYVFAHYMVCYANYGDTIGGFKQEIQDAQAAGIDGFALNCGEWNSPGAAWYYTNRVEMLYQAAEQLGTGFKFFFSVDENNTNEIVAMISSHANRTNSFRYQGKLVVSTFCEGGFWWTNAVLTPLKQMGIDTFFVPFFNTEAGFTWQTLVPATTALVSKYGSFLDGLFVFASGVPTDVTNLDAAYSQACRNGGKLFMAGCSPLYWGCAQYTSGRPYFESQGGEGIATEWNWIIQNQPDWVEIVTWNDLNEGTYINPLATPDQYSPSPIKRYTHAGYLELTKRYISWYKTGQQPPITQDALYYFYRTHSTNAVASNTNDIPVTTFLGNVQDVIYTTVSLTAPASLDTISGTNCTTNSLSAGISNVRIPFSSGKQQFTLRRSGVPLLTVQGPDILGQITNNDYFATSGYAYATNQMSAPSKLQVIGVP